VYTPVYTPVYPWYTPVHLRTTGHADTRAPWPAQKTPYRQADSRRTANYGYIGEIDR